MHFFFSTLTSSEGSLPAGLSGGRGQGSPSYTVSSMKHLLAVHSALDQTHALLHLERHRWCRPYHSRSVPSYVKTSCSSQPVTIPFAFPEWKLFVFVEFIPPNQRFELSVKRSPQWGRQPGTARQRFSATEGGDGVALGIGRLRVSATRGGQDTSPSVFDAAFCLAFFFWLKFVCFEFCLVGGHRPTDGKHVKGTAG